MNIVYMGTPEFAVPSLEKIYNSHHKILAVVTVPDKPKGRGQKLSSSPVKDFAVKNNLPVLQPVKLKDPEFISELVDLSPDVIVVVAFRILPELVFMIPKLGSFNLHGSLLPKYRGAAPINHAIMNGETETGVTTFFLDKKVDTGNIILQKKIEIHEDDNATSLHDKMKIIGADTVIETLNLIENNSIQLQEQDDSLASPAPKIFKEDCKLDWTDSVKIIHNKIRGLSYYPAAFTKLGERIVKILKSKIDSEISDSEPGVISIDGRRLLVNTTGEKLEILELQPEGKSKMSASDFINGLKDRTNLSFG